MRSKIIVDVSVSNIRSELEMMFQRLRKISPEDNLVSIEGLGLPASGIARLTLEIEREEVQVIRHK